MGVQLYPLQMFLAHAFPQPLPALSVVGKYRHYSPKTSEATFSRYFLNARSLNSATLLGKNWLL